MAFDFVTAWSNARSPLYGRIRELMALPGALGTYNLLSNAVLTFLQVAPSLLRLDHAPSAKQ